MFSTRPGQLRIEPKLLIKCAVILLAMLVVPSAHGHAELLLQIEEISREIEKKPQAAELYLKRGELRRTHLDWDLALADYERALALSPDMPTIDLLRGRLFLEAGWTLSARAFLDRFVARNPAHLDACV